MAVILVIRASEVMCVLTDTGCVVSGCVVSRYVVSGCVFRQRRAALRQQIRMTGVCGYA